MKGSVSIVNLEMGSLCAISLNMNSVKRHRVRVSAENSRLIHIIPEAVHVVASFENVVVK